jgi:hypothetical protein
MAEIINITPLNPTTFEFQEYSVSDTSLITSIETENSFDPTTDHIEYFIYDLNGNILTSNVFGYNGYRLLDNVLTIYPDIDLTTQGFTEGQYNTLYNFVSNKLASNPNNTYYISQISPDRTEVRLDTTLIPDFLVISSSIELSNNITTSTGSYYDFYLNFGDNELAIANNILLDTSSITNPTVLIKLYEPLPEQFTINSQLWVVTQVATPVAYNINIVQTFDVADNNIYLKGPNTNLSIKNQINNSTDYSNSNQLSVTDSTQGSGSLRYQLNSLLAKTGIEINIDYSNYDNFIHFSSAQTRLENFYYKLSLIEQYNYSASYSSTTPANYYVSSSNVVWQSKINEIITGFDNYEYFLYFDSGSASWPKTGSTPPYTNYTTTSTSGSNWFISQSLVAEEYDIENNNALINTIPSYLLEDPANAQYELFIEMIGQHFDNIFLYTQDVTNKYNNDNRLNYGVSKDLVADILRDMGIKIYQNNFSTNDLYSALLGLTPSGSLYNLPYTTGSLPTPSGYEYINTYITASSTSSLIPTEDINAEIYKRIYANLPYLLKKKGTVEGLRALITTYGIPDTILQVNEFGGQDKIIANDYDLWFNQYNYAFTTEDAGTPNYISASFALNPEWNSLDDVPQAVELRFKTFGLPQNTGSIVYQNIWNTSGSSDSVALILRYTGSGYDTNPPTSENPLGEPYSGSIANPYNQFGLLDFIPDITNPTVSASVYLPFFDGGWWSVLVNKKDSDFILYSANKNYEGEDGNYIGFISSSSVSAPDAPWNSGLISYFGISSSLADGSRFSGLFQEIRYYTVPLSQSEFSDYVMNPYSIDSNGTNTAPDTLAFRATLGGELYTSSISVHPKITGSWVITQSFDNGVVEANSNFNFETNPVFVPNTEIIYLNQFPAGIKNRVSNKIRQQNEILPYSGSNETNLPTNQVLSPFISIQQSVAVSGSYTPNIDYVEVAFSPQNQINNDIAGQLGYFNIGEYIGDPRLVPTKEESYPALDDIRDYYFEKYTGNYNIWDYIRLIKYFDNSLFKMIADWTPARTDLASGIVIKQTTLERNKYPVPQLNITSSLAMVESGSYITDLIFNLTDAEISPDGQYIVLPTQSYNLGTTFTGSFNNVSGFDGSNCYIFYFTPDALFGPPIVLLDLSGVNSLRTGDEVSYNFTYSNIVSGSKIEFYCDSSVGSVLLDAYVTGSGFEASNVSYEVEDLLITGSSIQMVNITGSSGGSIVDTETLVYSTSSFNLTTGNSITFNLSSSGAERVLCRISSSAEDVFNAVVTLSNQGTTVYSNSDPKFNYTLNETFNISSGYLTISNNSDAATLTISGLEVYQAPSYYQTVETVYGLNQVLIPNEFDFNGELQGSEILVTDGDLNGGNPFLTFPTQEYKYDIQVQLLLPPFSAPFTLQEWFEFSVSSGQIKLLADQSGDTDLGLIYAKISKTSLNGLDTTSTLEDLQDFRIDILSPTGTYETHTVISIQEQLNYYLYTLVPDSITYTATTYSDRLVVFSPVDSAIFVNSNYDTLINNASITRVNPEFFDVDFSTNAITAVNRVNIISASRGTGSATPSTTPASNYTTARIANPRYNGCKNTSPDFNIIDNQQLPSVEQLTRVGLYYEQADDANPELPGTTNFQIKFMFDELGNVFTPSLTSSYYGDLLDAFPTNTQVNVVPFNPKNPTTTINVAAQSSIQGIQTVFWPGVYFNSYLTSQSGSISSANYQTGSIRIGNLSDQTTDLFTLAPATAFSYWATTQSADPLTTLTFGSDLSQIFYDNLDTIITNFNTQPYVPGQNTVINYNFYNDPSITYIQLESTESNPNRAGFDQAITPIAVSPYYYNFDSYSYTGSFSPYPDWMRIQNITTNEFIYIEVDHLDAISGVSSTTAKIILKSPVPSAYIESFGRINEFTLLRLTPSPEKLYLNIKKSVGYSGPGFILPQYPSTTFKTNLPSIIENLTNKNLI